MRTPRKRNPALDVERGTHKRRKSRDRSGRPQLSLWECGIGAVWK